MQGYKNGSHSINFEHQRGRAIVRSFHCHQIFPVQRYCFCRPFLFSSNHQHIYAMADFRNNNEFHQL